MLSAVARLVTASGLQDAFDIVVANVALARRDWSLITELGIHGVSYAEQNSRGHCGRLRAAGASGGFWTEQ